MKTAVIGFPRVGTLRELKFASEKYFRGEIDAQELQNTAKELRRIHWSTQKDAGIDYISSNDFSFYDMVLDTAALLGIVPERYRKLQLPALDTYFAMARGYQGESGDVKALAMKSGLTRIIITSYRRLRTIWRSRSAAISLLRSMRRQRHWGSTQSRL